MSGTESSDVQGAQWYIMRGDEQFACPDEATLVEWSRAGRIAPSDLLWHPEFGQAWRSAIDVEFLRPVIGRVQTDHSGSSGKRQVFTTRPILIGCAAVVGLVTVLALIGGASYVVNEVAIARSVEVVTDYRHDDAVELEVKNVSGQPLENVSVRGVWSITGSSKPAMILERDLSPSLGPGEVTQVRLAYDFSGPLYLDGPKMSEYGCNEPGLSRSERDGCLRAMAGHSYDVSRANEKVTGMIRDAKARWEFRSDGRRIGAKVIEQ